MSLSGGQGNDSEAEIRRKGHWDIVMGKTEPSGKETETSSTAVPKETSKDPLECKECPVKFTGKSKVSNFNKHTNSVHRKHFPHVCSRCPKKFPYRHKLEHHFNTVHRGIKAFACNQCGKHFSDKSNLSKHQNGRSCFKNQTKKALSPSTSMLHDIS